MRSSVLQLRFCRPAVQSELPLPRVSMTTRMPPSSSLPVLRHLVGQQQQRSLLAPVDRRLSWQWTLEVEIV
jgi:hypothetical protein